MHTDLYYKTLADRLQSVPLAKVREELRKIARELADGIFRIKE